MRFLWRWLDELLDQESDSDPVTLLDSSEESRIEMTDGERSSRRLRLPSVGDLDFSFSREDLDRRSFSLSRSSRSLSCSLSFSRTRSLTLSLASPRYLIVLSIESQPMSTFGTRSVRGTATSCASSMAR
jgi:hypothetical protein